MTKAYSPPPAGDQLSFFGTGDGQMASPVRPSVPDPEQVRSKLTGLLAVLQQADDMPWSLREARLWRTTFPQMARWLPEDEGSGLSEAFQRELDRLEANIEVHGSVA